jgi:hypothetical protein
MVTRGHAWRGSAYLALVALALQLVLSFAHVHTHGVALRTVVQSRAATENVGLAQSRWETSQNLPSGLADDEEHCTICFSAFLLSGSSLPDAPRHPARSEFGELDTSFNFIAGIFFQQRRLPFLSRAPPAG